MTETARNRLRRCPTLNLRGLLPKINPSWPVVIWIGSITAKMVTKIAMPFKRLSGGVYGLLAANRNANKMNNAAARTIEAAPILINLEADSDIFPPS